MDNMQFPDCIKSMITNEFLLSFKHALDNIFSNELSKLTELGLAPTYNNFYQWVDNTNGFNKALEEACKKHDLMELYTYRDSKDLFDNEILGGQITEMLFQYNIVEEGVISELDCNLFQQKKYDNKYWNCIF